MGIPPKRPGGKRISPDDAFIHKVTYNLEDWVLHVEKKLIHGEWVDVKICRSGSTTNPISFDSSVGHRLSSSNPGDLYGSKAVSLFSAKKKTE